MLSALLAQVPQNSQSGTELAGCIYLIEFAVLGYAVFNSESLTFAKDRVHTYIYVLRYICMLAWIYLYVGGENICMCIEKYMYV